MGCHTIILTLSLPFYLSIPPPLNCQALCSSELTLEETKVWLTSRDRNHHSLLLFGLSPPATGLAGAGDDCSFPSTAPTSRPHHKRTRVHSLLQGLQPMLRETTQTHFEETLRAAALTMPEPLQLWQCWTLVPGSWPLPSQRWQAASMLMPTSLLTPFAAWVNVSSMMYCRKKMQHIQTIWIWHHLSEAKAFLSPSGGRLQERS